MPHLAEGGGGTIVTTGAYSIRSYHPARLPYVTLKSAVAAFTKSIARAYGSSGVRANCVCPGVIETGKPGRPAPAARAGARRPARGAA